MNRGKMFGVITELSSMILVICKSKYYEIITFVVERKTVETILAIF